MRKRSTYSVETLLFHVTNGHVKYIAATTVGRKNLPIGAKILNKTANIKEHLWNLVHVVV